MTTTIQTFLNKPVVDTKAIAMTPVVLLQNNEETPGVSSPRKRALLVSNAPTLSPVKTTNGYIDELVTYMTAILLESIKSNLNQAEVLKLQNSTADLFTKLGEINLQHAQENMQKTENESPLIKILTGVAAGLMMLGGLLTANPALVISGVILVVMTDSPAGSELNKALSKLPLGLKILAEVGIALALAVVSCGASGMISAGTSTAETTASTVAEEAGSNAACDGESAAENAATEASENNSNFWSNAGKLGFKSVGHVVSTTFSQGMSVGLSSDLVLAILKALEAAGVNIGKKNEELISAIGGALFSIGAGICSAQGATSAVLKSNAGNAVRGISTVGGVLSSGTGIYSGVNKVKASEVLMEKADIDASQTVNTSLATLSNAMIKQDNQAGKALFDTYAEINSRWSSYNEPGLTVARDLAG